MIIGIYGIASQSGRAFLADYLSLGYHVIGYNRLSEHGKSVIEAIQNENGLYLERPENTNNETSRFLVLGDSLVTADLSYMVDNADIIIIALPSIYHMEAMKAMCDVGIWKKRIPVVLSPSRSVATPYLWKIVGERYPVVCFSTCPYSCKAPQLNVSYIKRRKRTWIASLEGDFNLKQIELVKQLFPQAAITSIPALTSLNNIGAVFHCATYLLNYDEIERRKQKGEIFSFYIDGIARRPDVGKVLEEIDQVRLHIANALGIEVFGLKENPREDVWRKLTNGLRALEAEHDDEINILRNIRRQFMEYLNNSVLSAQHWLDITYGVVRIEGEDLSHAIGRTPTYQKNSVPQLRYIEEDIPTGLVVFESLADMLNVDCRIVTEMIDLYDKISGKNVRDAGRNLRDFSSDYILNYLKGEIK